MVFSITRISTFIFSPILVFLLTASAPPPPVPEMAEGCELIGEPLTGALYSREQAYFTFDLEAGIYTFAAWATWDLGSLGLTILDSDGAELAHDDGLDNSPMKILRLNDDLSLDVVLTAGDSLVPFEPGAFTFVVTGGERCFERIDDPGKGILDDWAAIISEGNEEIVYWVFDDLSGEESLVLNYRLDPGSYFAAAETIDHDDDIDMYIRQGDLMLSMDEYPNNYPVCYFDLTETTVISITVESWEYAVGIQTAVIVVVARKIPAPESRTGERVE
ncbi:hypothetical protein KAU08_01185 [bacterium]|nr:hypothetical protein [bacterium]